MSFFVAFKFQKEDKYARNLFVLHFCKLLQIEKGNKLKYSKISVLEIVQNIIQPDNIVLISFYSYYGTSLFIVRASTETALVKKSTKK